MTAATSNVLIGGSNKTMCCRPLSPPNSTAFSTGSCAMAGLCQVPFCCPYQHRAQSWVTGPPQDWLVLSWRPESEETTLSLCSSAKARASPQPESRRTTLFCPGIHGGEDLMCPPIPAARPGSKAWVVSITSSRGFAQTTPAPRSANTKDDIVLSLERTM